MRSRSTPPGRPELFDPARDRCRSGDTDDLVITPKPLQRAIRFVRAHGATPAFGDKRLKAAHIDLAGTTQTSATFTGVNGRTNFNDITR